MCPLNAVVSRFTREAVNLFVDTDYIERYFVSTGRQDGSLNASLRLGFAPHSSRCPWKLVEEAM